MLYEFQHEDTGARMEADFDMAGPKCAPTIGSLIPGTRWRRLPSIPVRPTVRDIHFKAYSQPIWAEGAAHYDKSGTPCFSSRSEVNAYVAAQNRLTDKDGSGQQGGEYLGYDASPTKGN
jgi:hypothetical protein